MADTNELQGTLGELSKAGEQAGALGMSVLPHMTEPGNEAPPQDDDAWLNANLGEVDGDDGDTSSDPLAEPAGTSEPSPEGEAVAEQEAPASAQPGDDKLEEALAVLKRGNLELEDVKDWSDEKILARAEKLQKHQAEMDAIVRERNELRKRQESEPEASTTEATGADPVGEPPERMNLRELTKPLAEHLALDDEGAEALAQFHEKIITQQQQRETKMVTDLQQAVLGMQVELARRDLGEKFPQMSDATSRQAVLDKMDALDASKFSSVTELMEAAASQVFADSVTQEVKGKLDQLRQLRRTGGTSPATPAKIESTDGLSDDAREDRVLDLIEAGELDKARSLAR